MSLTFKSIPIVNIRQICLTRKGTCYLTKKMAQQVKLEILWLAVRSVFTDIRIPEGIPDHTCSLKCYDGCLNVTAK